MLVMVVFFIAFRWIHLSTPLIRLRSEERFSRNAETDLVCRLLLEKKKSSLILSSTVLYFFMLLHPSTTASFTLSLHDALPISLLLLQLLRHLFYRHLKLHRQRYILIV